MITLTVASNVLRGSIPTEMNSKAPNLLADIWRPEFVDKPIFILELTESVKQFVEKAKLIFDILVYQ